MHSQMTRPLVTFALFTYNQEKFVRCAIRGALAQTYSPLEIICSDDCSSDGTVAIMRDELARYTGKHVVRLNVNSTNLGLAAHISHVVSMAKGDLVVLAGGDDISFAERTQVLVETWLREGRRAMSLFSGYELIDEAGIQTGKNAPAEGFHPASASQRIAGNIQVEGATHAFPKQLYDDFGDFLPGTVNDDVVMQFRACLRDGVYVLSRPLAQYRKHGSSLTAHSGHLVNVEVVPNAELSHLRRQRNVLGNFAKDIRIAVSQAIGCLRVGRQLLFRGPTPSINRRAAASPVRVSSFPSLGELHRGCLSHLCPPASWRGIFFC